MTTAVRSFRLTEVARINPRRPELHRSDDAPTTFVPMHAVNEHAGDIRRAEVRPYALVAKGYTYFEEGDVLFAKITPCMQNGKHALATQLIDGIGFGSTEFHVFRALPGLHPEWLLHFLRQDSVITAAQNCFTGSVGQQRVPDSFFRDLEIPLPPVEVQERLLHKMRQALAESRLARDAIREQKDLAERLLRSAIFRDAFANVQPPVTVGRTRSTKAGWSVSPLQSLARLESGHTPSRRRPEWWGGNVPWLALPDIRKLHGKYAYETTEYTNDAGLANSAARLLPVGTVCLCRDASIGFVTILGRPMATSQHFCNWVCDPDRLDAEFLLYAFMASHDDLRELGSGSVLKTIYMPTIESFQICAPGIDEQRRIARVLRERLAAGESLQAGLQSRLAEIERLPETILATAFVTS